MDVASSWRTYVVLRMTGADLIYTSICMYILIKNKLLIKGFFMILISIFQPKKM